jgi:hypothetical protein
MSLVNITPVMTSNTTPSPYVVSASGIYSTDHDAWKAFDNITAGTQGWVTQNGAITGWLKIDFGSTTKISAISIVGDGSSGNVSPKSFLLYGSSDDIVYEKLMECNNEILWLLSEERIYKLPIDVSYRYYKIIINSNNNYSNFSALNEVRFWQDDGAITAITNIEASMDYCLPKNSTLAMNQRQNDAREGLLGFANDGNNYGTLYLINHTGKAQIPMAALANADVLFDGLAGTSDMDYSINNDYKKYKYLLIDGGAMNGAKVRNQLLIPTSTIDTATVNQFMISGIAVSYNYFIYIYFTSSTTFRLTTGVTGWTTPAVTKVYGIK